MKTGKSAIAGSYATRRLFTLLRKEKAIHGTEEGSRKLADLVHFRDECLQRADRFFRSGKLSDILSPYLNSTTGGFTIKLI